MTGMPSEGMFGVLVTEEYIAACKFIPSIFVNELGFSNASSLFRRRS
jgi:hypothetical protein